MSTILLCLIGLATTMQTYTDDWTDTARQRTVPVRIFLPNPESTTAKFPVPVVLLSHGLGGSREGFGYLGQYWADHGFAVIAMQHPGSDISLITQPQPGVKPREAMLKAMSGEQANNRVGDVKFILDQLEKRNKDDEKLKGKLDLNRIGIGGHSFGSYTTFASIGRFPFKADPRIKAAIVMSPNMLKNVDPKKSHQDIKVPILHLTGTKDDSPMDRNTKPEDRRVPFDNLSGNQYLVIFKDGNHMLFSGHKRPLGQNRLEKKYQPMIQEITIKFLDAFLKDDQKAKHWLDGKDFGKYIGENGITEIR